MMLRVIHRIEDAVAGICVLIFLAVLSPRGIESLPPGSPAFAALLAFWRPSTRSRSRS